MFGIADRRTKVASFAFSPAMEMRLGRVMSVSFERIEFTSWQLDRST